MPTFCGLAVGDITPNRFRNFAERIGVTKTDGVTDVGRVGIQHPRRPEQTGTRVWWS